MSVVRWLLAAFLLSVLVVAVGAIAVFVAVPTSSPLVLVGAAALAVLAWHGLRRLEPRPEDARPEELRPAEAIILFAAIAGFMLLVRLSPWVLLFTVLVVPVWLRYARR